MADKCPKCNCRLSAFYFKPKCPKCGINLMYYEMESRLESDAQRAQKEWDSLSRFLLGIKRSSIGSFKAVLRLAAYVLQIAALLPSVFIIQGTKAQGLEKFSLISLIREIINYASGDGIGELFIGVVFAEKALSFALCSVLICIVFALSGLVLSLFSFQKSGFKRNAALSVIQITAFCACFAGAAFCGALPGAGFFICLAAMAAALALHFSLRE